MKVVQIKLRQAAFPKQLLTTSPPPKQIFYSGTELGDWLNMPKVSVVGSRKFSGYGRSVTEKLVTDLVKAGVVIISGLALGVDSIAHRAALKAGGITIAVLPTSLDKIYPASHRGLADQILKNGGALISEYPKGSETFPGNFIARNRIISALGDCLLITEAAEKSGTLHTARFALEQGKTVMVVPGNITSPGSVGCNRLIKAGAVPVTDATDIFFELGIKAETANNTPPNTGHKSHDEVIRFIAAGVSDQEELALKSGLEAAQLADVLTSLEISGHIRPTGSGQWQLV